MCARKQDPLFFICLRHLIRSRAVIDLGFSFPKRPIFLHVCATCFDHRVALYTYYIYIELACTQSPFFQNLPYLATLGLPYEFTKCKQINRILVICAHCPRIASMLLRVCADNVRRKIRFLCLHLVHSYGRSWEKGDWVHASSMYFVSSRYSRMARTFCPNVINIYIYIYIYSYRCI